MVVFLEVECHYYTRACFLKPWVHLLDLSVQSPTNESSYLAYKRLNMRTALAFFLLLGAYPLLAQDLVLDCPTTVNVECSDPFPSIEDYITDGCPPYTVSESSDITPGDCPQEWTEVITSTVTDDCGSQVECVWTLVVKDTTPPSADVDFFGPPIECGEVPFVVGTVTDACDPEAYIDLLWTGSASGSQFGFALMEFNAVDACGNIWFGNQLRERVDTTPPVVDVGTSAPIDCGGSFPEPSIEATDTGCGDELLISFEETLTEPDACGNQTLTRTWTVIDEADNQTVVDQVFTIVDSEAPVVNNSAPAVQAVCGPHVWEALYAGLNVEDCNDVTLEFSETVLVIEGTPVYKLDVLATDICGNAGGGSFTAEILGYMPTDLDQNFTVDTSDLLVALGEWECLDDCVADVDGDGLVGTPDLLAILGGIGTLCE